MDLDRYMTVRPWVYHLTARQNLEGIRKQGALHSAARLAKSQPEKAALAERRTGCLFRRKRPPIPTQAGHPGVGRVEGGSSELSMAGLSRSQAGVRECTGQSELPSFGSPLGVTGGEQPPRGACGPSSGAAPPAGGRGGAGAVKDVPRSGRA